MQTHLLIAGILASASLAAVGPTLQRCAFGKARRALELLRIVGVSWN